MLVGQPPADDYSTAPQDVPISSRGRWAGHPAEACDGGPTRLEARIGPFYETGGVTPLGIYT